AILTLIAQETYTQGKIDMHGGSQEAYRSNFTSFGTAGFRNSRADMSKFLDKNTTKKTLAKKLK
ncbi:MAG: hypothetical protein Q9M32_01685, partial [Sulfurimonas sp.]|nr:hypothetical protein [Sulfurimonas sp.]